MIDVQCGSIGRDGRASALPAVRAVTWFGVLGLSALVFVIAHWKALTCPFVINDDLRQQVFWMQRWLDPALYPPDLLNAYAEAYVPWGVKFLYWLGSRVMNPVQFSKVLTGILYLGECLLVFCLGRRLGARACGDNASEPTDRTDQAGWAAVAAVWLMPFFLDNISGGLSRAYASPLLAAFALSFLTGSRRWTMTVLAAQALFIPYIFLPCAMALAASRAWDFLRGRKSPWLDSWLQWGLLAAMAAVVGAFSMVYASKGFGPLVKLADTLGRPEFGPDGRLDLVPLPNPFLDFVYFPFERIGLFRELTLIPGILSLLLLSWPVLAGARRTSWRDLGAKARPLLFLAGAFLFFYCAARVLAFSLFVPDRYVQYPVNLLYALALSACLLGAWRHRNRSGRLGRIGGPVLLALLALLGGIRQMGVALIDVRADEAVYAGVQAETPKDALLAGMPELIDNVLIFGKRNVLFGFELAQPWSVGYWNRLSPRIDAFIEAYYADDPEAVVRFAREFRLDFLVVDEAHYTPTFLAAGHLLFEPYGRRIKEMTRGRTDFSLLNPSLFPRISLKPGVFLVDLRPFRQDSGPIPTPDAASLVPQG